MVFFLEMCNSNRRRFIFNFSAPVLKIRYDTVQFLQIEVFLSETIVDKKGCNFWYGSFQQIVHDVRNKPSDDMKILQFVENRFGHHAIQLAEMGEKSLNFQGLAIFYVLLFRSMNETGITEQVLNIFINP